VKKERFWKNKVSRHDRKKKKGKERGILLLGQPGKGGTLHTIFTRKRKKNARKRGQSAVEIQGLKGGIFLGNPVRGKKGRWPFYAFTEEGVTIGQIRKGRTGAWGGNTAYRLGRRKKNLLIFPLSS